MRLQWTVGVLGPDGVVGLSKFLYYYLPLQTPSFLYQLEMIRRPARSRVPLLEGP